MIISKIFSYIIFYIILAKMFQMYYGSVFYINLINNPDFGTLFVFFNFWILYKGAQILKMDIFKMSKTQKNFPLYKKKFLKHFILRDLFNTFYGKDVENPENPSNKVAVFFW